MCSPHCPGELGDGAHSPARALLATRPGPCPVPGETQGGEVRDVIPGPGEYREVKSALPSPGRGLSPPQTHGVSRQWAWPVPASTRLDTPRGHGETVYTGRVTFRGTMGNQTRAATGPLGLEGEGKERLPQAGQGRCEGRRPAPRDTATRGPAASCRGRAEEMARPLQPCPQVSSSRQWKPFGILMGSQDTNGVESGQRQRPTWCRPLHLLVLRGS